MLGDERYPGGSGLPPLADPVSWSNVTVQNRNFSALQARFGKFNQILEGCAYTGGAGHGYTDAMDGCTEKVSCFYLPLHSVRIPLTMRLAPPHIY